MLRYEARHKFTRKLILSIALLSVVGLFLVFLVVNTVVRSIIHENVIGAVYSDMRTTSKEIDAWINVGNHVVNNLARVCPAVGTEYVKPMVDGILDEYDYIVEIYIGFADGRYLGSEAWTPDNAWDSASRPWYRQALAGCGQLITTTPYKSATEEHGIITTVAKWLPDLDGMEAVVAADISTDSVIEKINQFRLAGGGYFILAGPEGEIISHPNVGYIVSAEDVFYLEDIPNGDFMMKHIASRMDSSTYINDFDDFKLGASYFMTFHLESTGWTLAAVIPTVAVSQPVSQSLWVIMLAFTAVLATLFALTVIFMSLLTKNMEEGRVVAQRMQMMLDSSPLLCTIFDENSNVLEANQEAVRLFEITDKQLYIDDYFAFSPELQPDGTASRTKAIDMLKIAREQGHSRFEWTYMTSNGEMIPCEEIIMNITHAGGDYLIAYTRDLRDFYKYKETEIAAYTDPLTGARNRRFLMTAAEKELQACAEKAVHFSLIMMDIDFFKKVNDTYGHPVGDEVLKIVVARIRSSLRKDTLVARYGGEEFVITLPGVNGEKALEIADKIRLNVASSAFLAGDLKIPVTVSLGVAGLCQAVEGMTLTDIINNADKALYQAKKTGRNKAQAFYDPVDR